MAHLKGKVEGVLHFTFKAALGWRLIWLKKFGGPAQTLSKEPLLCVKSVKIRFLYAAAFAHSDAPLQKYKWAQTCCFSLENQGAFIF